MNLKNKAFFWISSAIVVAVVGALFFKFFIFRDYIVEADVDCDPMESSCFTYLCDPEWEECTGDLFEDTWYYSKIRKSASQIADCDSLEDECEIDCGPNDMNCEVIFCDDAEEDCCGPGVEDCIEGESEEKEEEQDEENPEDERDDELSLEAEVNYLDQVETNLIKEQMIKE